MMGDPLVVSYRVEVLSFPAVRMYLELLVIWREVIGVPP